jgi:hypothetical protein
MAATVLLSGLAALLYSFSLKNDANFLGEGKNGGRRAKLMELCPV